MIEYTLTAEKRDAKGKGASRRLRRTNKVPGIMYGAGKDAMPLMFDHNELIRNLQHESFYSHILTIKIGAEEERAVLKDLQRHPARPTIQHLDLQRVSETEKLRMHIPLHFKGEDISPGVKTNGGVVSHQMVEVEVSCLPKHLPEFIEVDVSALDIGDSLHLSNLVLPEGVELVELLHGDEHEHDLPVVSIHKARVAEVEEAPVVAAAAVPVVGTPPEAKS